MLNNYELPNLQKGHKLQTKQREKRQKFIMWVRNDLEMWPTILTFLDSTQP